MPSRPSIPAAFAPVLVEAASSAEALGRLLRAVRDGELTRAAPPPLGSWLPLYRRHRALRRAVLGALGCERPAEVDGGLAFLQAARAVHRTPASLKELEGLAGPLGEAFAPVMFRSALLDVPGLLSEADAPVSPHEKRALDAFAASAEGWFFLRVWMPCWVHHRTTPGHLLRRARGGDLDALDALIRLDKAVLADPWIGRHVHRMTHGANRSDRVRLLNALGGTPKGKMDSKRIKLALAGLMSQAAALGGVPLSAGQIHEVFASVSRARGGNRPDGDLPFGDAFAKAVRRNRDWPLPGVGARGE
jgi:hypothetical protein